MQRLHGFEAPEGPDTEHGLPALTAVKLWGNPCWLSFRINLLALSFNVPIYGWIEERYGLQRPQFIVLYSLKLMDGVAAKDVCNASGFPKNTISRAIHSLLRRKLIRRVEDGSDRRSFVLSLMPAGRAIADSVLPAMLERESIMLKVLTPAERHMLFALLGKMVIDSANWPQAMDPATET